MKKNENPPQVRTHTKNLTTYIDKNDPTKAAFRKPPEDKQIEIIDLSIKNSPKIRNEKMESDLGQIDFSLQPNPPMPYKQLKKQKKFLHEPFTWKINEKLAKKIENSLYKLVPIDENGRSDLYQIQPNREKIRKIRQQIDITFEYLYRICFYNQTNIDYSTEINKLKRLLKTATDQIEVEKRFNYQLEGESILLNNVLSSELYEENAVLIETLLKNKLVPYLQLIKSNYFDQNYLENSRDKLIKDIEKLGNELNFTATEIFILNDKAQSANSIHQITSKNLDRMKALKYPKEFFDMYIDLHAELRLLYLQSKVLSETRNKLKKYLKIKILLKELEPQVQFLDKLIEDLKNLIIILNTRLMNLKLSPKEVKKAYMKIELNIDENKLNLEQMIENKAIQKIILTGIKDVFNYFEKECSTFDKSTIEKENNASKLVTMLKTCQTYMDLCTNFKKSLDRIKFEASFTDMMITKNEYFKTTKQDLKEELLEEYSEIKDIINKKHELQNKDHWKPKQLIPGISSTVHEFTLVNKNRVHMNRAIAFKLKYIQTKLAKIIRKRIKVKNKLFFSNTKRIRENLGVNDVIELIKSKRIWQSLPGVKSEIINIQGTNIQNKTLNRYVYCNEDLDQDLLKFIGMFIYAIND